MEPCARSRPSRSRAQGAELSERGAEFRSLASRERKRRHFKLKCAAATFEIANAEQLLASNNAVFPNVGGPMPGGFDFGLPFFLGREVFVAIAGQDTPAGPGPYWAY